MKRIFCILNILMLLLVCGCATYVESQNVVTPTFSPTPTATLKPTPSPTPEPTKAPDAMTFEYAPEGYTGQYIIAVNRLTNRVYVYQHDNLGRYTILVKAFICSVGASVDDSLTPVGGFYISDKYTWRALYGGSFGKYAMRITDAYLFHSVPYASQSNDSLLSEEFNKLGQAASQGCVRMAARDAKWLYDNCEANTFVYIYEKEETGPVPEPVPIIDLNDPRKVWDPTDPEPDNPWNQ